MATLQLFQRFEVTVGTVTYSGGSLSTATNVTVGATSAVEGVFDTNVLCTTTAIKVFDNARDLGGEQGDDSDFDFMWVENLGAVPVRLQITADAGTADSFFVIKLASGERWTMITDAAVVGTTIDNFATYNGANTIDEVWAATSADTAILRLIAIT